MTPHVSMWLHHCQEVSNHGVKVKPTKAYSVVYLQIRLLIDLLREESILRPNLEIMKKFLYSPSEIFHFSLIILQFPLF